MFLGVVLQALQIVAIDYLNITLINQTRFQLNFLNLSMKELGESDFQRTHSKTPEQWLKQCLIHHNLILE